MKTIDHFIMNMDNKTYFYWQPVIGAAALISTYINFFFATYDLRNMTKEVEATFLAYNVIIETMFLADLLLPFFIEFKTLDGRIVRKLDKIAERYVTSWSFWYYLLPIVSGWIRNLLMLTLLEPEERGSHYDDNGNEIAHDTNLDVYNVRPRVKWIRLISLIKVLRLKKALDVYSITPMRKLIAERFKRRRERAIEMARFLQKREADSKRGFNVFSLNLHTQLTPLIDYVQIEHQLVINNIIQLVLLIVKLILFAYGLGCIF